MKTFNLTTTGLILIFIGCQIGWSEPTLSGDPNTAWQQVQQAAALTTSPATWMKQPSSHEDVDKFYKQLGDDATAAADKAKAFYTQFPHSTNALAAKEMECKMLGMAFHFDLQLGQRKPAYEAWANAQAALLADPKLTSDDRFDLRVEIAQRQRDNPNLDWKARDDAYEKALRELIKDYPQKEKPYHLLAILAAESPDDQARSIATNILAQPVPGDARTTAQAILRRLDAVGKPLDIQFTALDGRTVDLSQMKGKVVLLDFWATWCGPCVGEIPHVKEAYEKYHSKGFEVIGISFDGDKQSLTRFVHSRDLPWPQYYDGLVWKNKFGVQYAIDSIPTMWLVDKKGNLHTEDARENLQDQVEKLLAEND